MSLSTSGTVSLSSSTLGLCRHGQMEPDLAGIFEEVEDFTEIRVRVTELI